jgi:predicted dehydrogenase
MIGVAVVGTGYWGRNHVRAYKELENEGFVKKVKICDANEGQAKKMSNTYKVEYITDPDELLNDPQIQAVNIVTPSLTHYALAKKFMEAGKDVLVEKPVTMNSAEAKELIEIAGRTGRILMAGHIFRYHPAVKELKRRIELGELGEVKMLFTNRFFFGLPRKDMGVVYALGIHELDLFCYLLDREFPHSLTAVTTHTFKNGIEETAFLALDFGEATGYALESWLVPVYGKKRDLVIIGSEKCAFVDYLNLQELTLFEARIFTDNDMPVRVEDEGRQSIPLTYAEPLKEELRHFLACVKQRSKPLTDGEVGWRAVLMAEKALESSKTGRRIIFNHHSI